MSVPHSAVCWFVVCDCGLSCSYVFFSIKKVCIIELNLNLVGYICYSICSKQGVSKLNKSSTAVLAKSDSDVILRLQLLSKTLKYTLYMS